jgi:hypothetical protein
MWKYPSQRTFSVKCNTRTLGRLTPLSGVSFPSLSFLDGGIIFQWPHALSCPNAQLMPGSDKGLPKQKQKQKQKQCTNILRWASANFYFSDSWNSKYCLKNWRRVNFRDVGSFGNNWIILSRNYIIFILEAASSTTNRLLIIYTINSSSIPLTRKQRDIIRTLSTVHVVVRVLQYWILLVSSFILNAP